MRKKTLVDIARIAKVSHVTVSLALRAHPRIPKSTRDRIQAIAKKIGYRPDPVLSALVAYRRGVTISGNKETLAWINVWPDPKKLREAYGPYWEGSLERCAELGYTLEEFRLADFKMSASKLSRTLRTRNIQGLFLPPQYHNRAHLNLEWQHFSALAFGYTLVRPKLHVISNAQFRSGVAAMRALRRLGHRRIGFVIEHFMYERSDHNYAGAYLTEQIRLKAKERIPPLILAGDPDKYPTRLVEWFEKYRPDAVLTAGQIVETSLAKAGYLPKKDYSLAGLYVRDPGKSGIDQNEHVTGRTAVDLMVGMLYRNERGIPLVPSNTLIEGRWMDGKTARKISPPPA